MKDFYQRHSIKSNRFRKSQKSFAIINSCSSHYADAREQTPVIRRQRWTALTAAAGE
jgi:hypothetical protein